MNTNDVRNDIPIAVRSVFRGDFFKQLDGIREEYEYVCSIRDKYAQQLDDWNKAEEIQKSRELAEYYRSHSLHMLSDKEAERIKTFRSMHYESCGNGRSFTFELTGTGIGEAITIVCPVCGQKEDVTDLDDW